MLNLNGSRPSDWNHRRAELHGFSGSRWFRLARATLATLLSSESERRVSPLVVELLNWVHLYFFFIWLKAEVTTVNIWFHSKHCSVDFSLQNVFMALLYRSGEVNICHIYFIIWDYKMFKCSSLGNTDLSTGRSGNTILYSTCVEV